MEYHLQNKRGMAIYYKCPGCGREKTYQRYVEVESGAQVANDVGKCKSKECQYNYGPFTYYRDNRIQHRSVFATSFLPGDLFLKSLGRYNENNLFLYLEKEFGEVEAKKAVERYSIGTSNVTPGGSIFWQIDNQDRKRQGRITVFDADKGTEPGYWQSMWVTSYLPKTERLNVVSCLFGENLLKKEPGKPAVIVYRERDAVIASCLYPDYIWLALCSGFELPSKSDLLALSGRAAIWFQLTGFDRLEGYGIFKP